MTDDSSGTMATPRLALPMVQPGQAQKEMTLNEALMRIDLLCQASVVEPPRDQPPATPQPGRCWIVGTAPAGDWAGQAGSVAGWTPGGWRFVLPHEGLSVWIESESLPARFVGGAWQIGNARGVPDGSGGQAVGAGPASIAEPAGGITVDEPARAAINAIIAVLRTHGLIASG